MGSAAGHFESNTTSNPNLVGSSAATMDAPKASASLSPDRYPFNNYYKNENLNAREFIAHSKFPTLKYSCLSGYAFAAERQSVDKVLFETSMISGIGPVHTPVILFGGKA